MIQLPGLFLLRLIIPKKCLPTVKWDTQLVILKYITHNAGTALCDGEDGIRPRRAEGDVLLEDSRFTRRVVYQMTLISSKFLGMMI